MKILMVNVVCGTGSTGRICTDLAAALEADGHEVRIAYGRESVPEQFQRYAVRIGSDTDLRLHGLKARLTDGAGFGSRRATEKFVRWIRSFDPDIIHLHNIHGYYLHLGVLFDYLRTCGKRIIWTLHDVWAFTGHSAYCDTADCVLWKTGCHHCPLISEYPKSYSDRSDKNWARKKRILQGIPDLTLVTPSEWLAGLVRESFLAEYPVSVIRNGIDTSLFRPTDSDFRARHHMENKFILLGVASVWDHMKGLDDFVRLAGMLDGSCQIVLVGISPSQKQMLPENILAIERTNSVSELAALYSAADLFLNLSYCENYPTVNLEAMACGTPVLTYRTGGSPESAEPHRGIVIERGDLDQVIRAISRYRASFPVKPDPGLSREEADKKTVSARYQALYFDPVHRRQAGPDLPSCGDRS